MDLIDSLKDNHHQVGMDNIYNSAAFFRASYHHDCEVNATAWLARLVEAFLNVYSKMRRIIVLHSEHHKVPSRHLF